MADETAVVAESSPAIDEGTQILASMTSQQREHYWATGELPATEKEAEAESADTQEETAQSETPADAESADSQEEHETRKRPGQKSSAEERIKELIAERNELRRQLNERQPAETSPEDEAERVEAAQAPADDPRPVRPKRPRLDDSEDYQAFEAANEEYEQKLDEYTEELTAWKARQLSRETAAKQAQNDADAKAKVVIEAYNAQVVEAEAKYPDFREVVGNPSVQIPAVAQVAIVESERGAELAYFIAKDKKIQKRLLELNQKSTVAVVKELGRIEAALEAQEEEPERPPRPNPPARTTTRAPRPGYEASGTSGSPKDPVQDAVDAGDFRDFDRAMNARETERLSRRK